MELLDDTSPNVQQALLDEFQKHGPAAALFLRQIADGPNRMISFYARWYLNELRFADPVAEFRGFIRSLNFELETGVFLLCRTANRDLNIAAFTKPLDAMAARCRELLAEPSNAREKCRVLNRVLFHEYGFRADTDRERDRASNPGRDLVDQVLARKKGTPASLCIIYLLVARRLGFDLEPVMPPEHFVVGCYAETEPFFVDACEQGALRTPRAMNTLLRRERATATASRFAPAPVREVLGRCCRNLAAAYDAAGNKTQARLYAEFADELDE